MSSDQSSSGANPDASGEGQNPENKGTVAYDTYRKVLSEKKKRDEQLEQAEKELNDFRAKEKERVENELKAKENFKELLALRDKEKSELAEQLNQTKAQIERHVKFQSFLGEVNGVIPKQFESLIDVSKIIIDPVTQQPDPTSVQSVARDFEKNYGMILGKKASGGLPNEAARSGVKKLTVAEWNALPTAKEMKARYQEVDWST